MQKGKFLLLLLLLIFRIAYVNMIQLFLNYSGKVYISLLLLHCVLSLAAQCIVIGPVCGRVCNGRAGGWAGSVTTIT